MLIVISLKNIEIFFITKCSNVGFKMGSKVMKCNNRSIFTNCVSFFSLVQQQDIMIENGTHIFKATTFCILSRLSEISHFHPFQILIEHVNADIGLFPHDLC